MLLEQLLHEKSGDSNLMTDKPKMRIFDEQAHFIKLLLFCLAAVSKGIEPIF